jgi:hypothetical protein
MRAQWLRGVLAGGVAMLWSAAAAAQSGQPVQVVPITPVGPSAAAGPSGQTNKPAAPATVAVQAPVPQPALVVQPFTPAPQAPAPQAPATSSRKLELSFSNGRVSLTADNVTVSEILAEWVRKGGTVIDNGDKLTGGTVTFAFENESELKVLQALLRPYPGMIVVPRSPTSTIASTFARVNIVARSTASASGFVAPPNPPQPQGMPDDELPPVMPPGQIPGARVQGPSPNAPPPGPLTMPTTSQGGSARPGVMVAPVTPTPGTAVIPGQIIK